MKSVCLVEFISSNETGTLNCPAITETGSKAHSMKASLVSTPPKAKSTWVKPVGEQVAGKFVKNWDITSAFSRAGLYLEQTQDHGKHFVTCPWKSEHTETGSTDTIIFTGEWPQFHCSHSHCSSRDVSDAIGLLGVAA